ATSTAPPADPTTSTSPAAEQKPLTWADLDVDGNGTLSQTEAGSLQSLAQVFGDADADSNGELTPDEYKAVVARNNAAQPEASGGTDCRHRNNGRWGACASPACGPPMPLWAVIYAGPGP